MNKKIDVAIYVHEFLPEVGHSRAMIETLKHFPAEQVNNLHIIAYDICNIADVIKQYENKVVIHQCPKIFYRPFLIKMIWFYIYCFYIDAFKLDRNVKKIGIGIASLSAKYINIQFIHQEWEPIYFKYISMPFYKYVYKKILFFVFRKIEDHIYNQSNVKFSVLSQFETDYIKKKFSVQDKNIITNYSGVNFDRFKLLDQTKLVSKERIIEIFPELVNLDENKVTYLFIGALERKGVNFVIREFLKVTDAQLIIIGRPEGSSSINIPTSPDIFYIPFTKDVHLFYQYSDVFLFPTLYEPFGLVILEAASMGLNVLTTKKQVGASELLADIKGIHLFEGSEQFNIIPIRAPLSYSDKLAVREKVMKRMQPYSWNKTGSNFWKLLND